MPPTNITLSQPGVRGVVELPALRGYSRESGDTTIRRWSGRKQDIDGLLSWLRFQKVDFRESEDQPGIYKVEAEFANAQDFSEAPENPSETVWTLETNDLEKPLTAHPAIASTTYISSGQWQRAVQDVLENGVDASFYASAFLVPPEAQALFNLAIAGVESFEDAQYVVRRTVTLDRDAPFVTYHPLANVNKVYTLAQMLATFTDMPSNISDCLKAIAGEYLYRGSSWEVSSQGRRQITDQWWHADVWPRNLYEQVS